MENEGGDGVEDPQRNSEQGDGNGEGRSAAGVPDATASGRVVDSETVSGDDNGDGGGSHRDWDEGGVQGDGRGGDEDGVGGGSADFKTDVDILKQVWCNEKIAPEILQFEADLVERLQEQISLLEETIASISGDVADELMMSLYRMDVNRTLFLLRSYLRTRLSKIEMFADHITSSEDMSSRLSPDELEFASRYRDVFSKHLKQTVLDNLPENYQSMARQTSQSEEDDMTPTPQLDTFVVCRSKEAIGSFQLDDRSIAEDVRNAEGEAYVKDFWGDESVDLLQDDLHILRYRPIRRLLAANKIELI